MKLNRDACWLETQVALPGFDSFSINGKTPVTAVIREEMQHLFQGINETDKGKLSFELIEAQQLGKEGFQVAVSDEGKLNIQAQTEIGLLYGMFQVYEKLRCEGGIYQDFHSVPDQALRMINHWDNMDGSIERGYAGDSIFFKDGSFRRDFNLVRQYARLLASVGINGVSINNVNVHRLETRLITEEHLPEVKMINDIFASYGIKTFLSINFAAPKKIGGLDTADPLDSGVVAFWKETVANIYRVIPDFGGFVVKADSEGEPGPFAYGRGHDDGANLFGSILKEYGGLCIWRCFVYNCAQDWRDRSIDRARAAYDHFLPLDGKFEDNVVLQIKLGPLDFQVREPISPLFGALRNTNQIIEFQLTQEYTGQQKAIYYQVPVWKEALDFDTHHDYEPSVVKQLIKANSPVPEYSGICAVGVVGMDRNWTHHKLMQSNLYSYGWLAWNNQLTSELLAKRWTQLTFTSSSQKAQEKISELLGTSRETYALYNAPNGVGFMCRPNHHYGPDIDGYEYDRWGTYHFADRNGIGNDRTTQGTGFVEQYAPARCHEFNELTTCPDELLLWFHHVGYEHRLKNGKTLIQDIYDNHFEGVERVEAYQKTWSELKNEIAPADFKNVEELLKEQHRMAIEWRDQINTYFYRKSGIADNQGRKIYA
ncbi:alpha-glucuronidase [Candidatus Enterococcus leclercqii]|uniref:alpha-glucuronidase n=1 Tax=Candidatus Enterococcus leclercqii TaxID=1857218 RepID=UPI00137A5189|nr:alpha-glucuronidase [Enterococcus sp. CU9D]KAF1291322.1 alpha-glucuronidase [Enterococcus sp. CU9D]